MLVANSESCEPSSQNSNATTPNLLSNDDRKKRRSATERRASHRRRSSQAIAESGQLSQLLNGLQHQQRRGSNGSQHSVDMEGERSNNIISPIPDHHSDDPPEPTIPAPGGEEEDFDLEINSDPLDSLDHQTQDSGTDGQQSTPVIPSNSNNSLSAGFTPIHQRSVSDHLLHSVESARRRQQEISTTPGKEIHQEDATNNNKNSNAQHKNGSKLANQQHIFQSNSASKKQRAIVSTKAPPLLSQIRKLQQDDVENIANRQVDEPSSPKMRDNSDWHSPERGGAQDSSVSGSSTFGGQPTNKGPDRPPVAHHNFASNSFSSSSTSSSGFAQLVGRFSAHRQHSDSNLLRRTSPSIEEPARRSFKWKILWGRKSRVLEDITGKMDSHGVMKTAAHHQLGPLPEDSESELLGQKKRHSAIIEDAKQTPTPGGGTFVRMRASSSTEAIAGRDRPFSLMGTGGEELARYRVCEDEWQRLQLFLQEQRAKEEPPPSTAGGGVAEWDDSLEEEAITEIGHHPPPRRCPPPRMTRPAMGAAAAASSPISSSQTLGRPTKQKIQRAISTRAGASNAANVCSTLTLPRKKLPPKVAAQQQRRRNGAFVQQANRRRSIVHIGAEERQAIVAFVAEQQQQASTAAAAGNGEGQLLGTTAAKQQQKRTTGIGGGGTSSLKQLLNAGDRSRAKVAPKTKSGSSIAEQEQLATSINCRVDKDRKREAKANSVILNHIWSIRPRRKKEPNNSQRSLANLWTCQLDQRKANGGAAAAGDAPPLSSSGFDSPLPSLHHPSSAQSPLSPPVEGSPFSLDDVDTTTTAPLFQRPQLTQPRWEDLDLWAEQAPNWASKFADDRNFPGMAAAERKRQNVIYELVLTERNHCQVLVLLQQLYREGLLNNQIVSEEQLNTLIPDVLDALLDFHLTLLRRLKARCSEASVVEGVVDILIEHFQAGDHHRTAAIHAYTHFCLGREESDQQFASLMAQSQQFRKFMQFHGSEHKERTLKDCMLLVAQRLTKYPVLVEQMVKLESQAQRRELGQRACAAVRACCNEVDQRLQRHELDRQWSRLKKALDKAGTAKMIDPKGGQEFAANDLIWPVETEAGRGLRRVLLITRAFWRETMNGPDVELRLLLCDDLIVLLRPKSANSSNGSNGGKMPPLNFFRHNEHAGVLPLHSTLVRGENLRRKSLLLIVTAKERPDLFELAFPTCSELNNCVQAIKRAKAEAPTFVRMASGKFFELAERTIEEWDGRREELEFQGRVDQWRKELDKMFEEQTKAEEQLAQYFETRMAFMEKVRAQLEAIPRRRGLPSTGGGGGMDEDSKQLREHMRVRFGELKRFKAGSLVKLTERAQRLRDGDLLSWIDDLHDLGQGQQPAAAESSSDESPARSDSSEERRKPRRVCTYHGAADHQRQRNSGGSSGSAGGGIRRHTTVPGSRGPPITSSEEEERDEKSRLPLRVGPSQRRAAAELIRENIRLRSGLNKLKAKSALQELHLAALRSRCAREKAEEQIQPRQALEQMALELANREAELKRREAELTERETAIQPQASQEPETQTTVVKLKLDVKQQQQRENQKEAVQPQPTSSSSPPANGASIAGVRISQTYCGAGPVPSRTTNAVDSPQLNADRRAISQTELPRHLAVKTETKQRRK